MHEIRRPLSEKNLGPRGPNSNQDRANTKDQTRPNSSNSLTKCVQVMKSSVQLQKQNQNFYSKYFSSKEQNENQEFRANLQKSERPNSAVKTNKSPKEIQEYKKLHDKLQYLESKITNIKSHIDSSQKQAKTGLASKFFSQNQNSKVAQSNAQLNIKQLPIEPPPQQKLKSSTMIHNEYKASIEQSIVKKPSLSTFVTQVKPVIEQKQESKLILNKPETAKSNSNFQKSNFSRRKNSSEKNTVQKESSFLFYISSIIRGYMAIDITKQIEQIREHLMQTMQAQQFARTIKQTSQAIIDEKKTMLPATTKRTIVFDLDETLIHCNESIKIQGDIVLPIKFPTGEIIEASINIRPYAQQVLQTLSRHFELIVFTASHSCYANVVIDYLDPTRQWISHRFFRESCVQTDEGAYLKDLRVLGNRSLNDMVLIDNAAYSFCLQQHNGIPIINFYDNKQDQELLYLQNYIMALKHVKDVRSFNQQYLKLDKFTTFSDPIELLQQLFKEYVP